MTTDERNNLIVELIKTLQKLDTVDPIVASVKFVKLAEGFIDKIHDAGKVDSFNEAYKEAKRQAEKEIGKLN